MKPILSLLLALLICAACDGGPRPLTACRGHFEAANAGLWTPTPAQLTKAGNQP